MNENEETRGMYHTITYGCQMNEHDSEKLAGVLEEDGYTPTEDIEKADVIIINTCCVRENAELKVFGKVGSLKQYKRQNPELIIGICGCMMQQEEIVQEIKEKYSHVDIVFGTHNIHRFPELLAEARQFQNPLIEVWEQEKGLIPELPAKRESDYQAWTTIVYGCDNFCSYCIVPYVRGRERSRPVENILKEVRELSSEGIKEITLLGQNVNSYGKDLSENIDFADLLQELNKVDGIERIRYMTSHPRDFNQKLIETIADTEKVCEHIHLPMQSGSSKILKEMKRGYNQEEYLELVKEIREAMPEVAISTDFIVGFPGESEADFQETLKVVKEVKFDMAYTFLYSQRSGTPAAKLEEQIPKHIKKERLERLMDLQSQISQEQNEKLVGKTLEVLVEGESKKDSSKLTGRSRSNKIVIFSGDSNLTGELINVNINKAQSWTLFGSLIE
ncbi:tRNA (N6-isopentenyl adenosine(37)-C2)-methylthiotransferase MiaB [Fuchsiella alkaliacetigena]|uniref:tRNA (N6-isopentenyl adenosine(37)-C2)-methylthiotransferase MiaB n=1 Tax=Fuchsiella alkaliacetigena TaxID=957042 RepID=UPI00200B9F1C|nr:tRNA (N6-isopentenyl adenosine(37)-C2)-methylthiotransferase MiaB [Fuchsiella alkaliacetigena]MCK8825031.1 tRNA (N6-isopentenyl adenosine(37)-C2)-methylthiotransferase MiaB [Fuchsiella alkaliacetigena]